MCCWKIEEAAEKSSLFGSNISKSTIAIVRNDLYLHTSSPHEARSVDGGDDADDESEEGYEARQDHIIGGFALDRVD